MSLNRSSQKAEKWGRWAETLASWLLLLKGFRILQKRFKCPFGEVDLVAKRGSTLIFVEVKARKTVTKAYEALRPSQLSRIRRAAEIYLAQNSKYRAKTIRFDVILIVPNKVPIHLTNAW